MIDSERIVELEFAGIKSQWAVAAVLIAVWVLVASRAECVEQLTFNRDGQELRVAGKILVEAQDGGVLLLSPDGVLWIVQPSEIVRREHDATPFEPLDARDGQATAE